MCELKLLQEGSTSPCCGCFKDIIYTLSYHIYNISYTLIVCNLLKQLCELKLLQKDSAPPCCGCFKAHTLSLSQVRLPSPLA